MKQRFEFKRNFYLFAQNFCQVVSKISGWKQLQLQRVCWKRPFINLNWLHSFLRTSTVAQIYILLQNWKLNVLTFMQNIWSMQVMSDLIDFKGCFLLTIWCKQMVNRGSGWNMYKKSCKLMKFNSFCRANRKIPNKKNRILESCSSFIRKVS